VKQPLAIVGASARAAAASAVRAGFQPVTADLFADLDLRAIATATRIAPYPEGLLDWLRAIEPPAWMYTGALENHPELVDQMAWLAPLWGNPGDVLARVRSPWELAAALGSAGLLFPETRSSPDGLPRDGSWLAKTYRGAGGSGVRELVEGGSQAVVDAPIDSPHLPLSPSPPLCYQRRMVGTPCAAVFIAADGAATLLGVTRQLVGEAWLGAQGFQYAGSIGPLVLDESRLAAVARCGNVLAEQFELVGLFGVDFLLDGERVWPLEVNPRYTASVEIIERATGVDAISAHAAAYGGLPISDCGFRISRPPSAPRPSSVHGKAILFAKHDLVVSEPFAAMALAEASRQPWPMLADISSAATLIEAGRPVLTVFADGATDAEVEIHLRERVAKLERTLYPD
jgi:predicted ATP-grasp superfamily ATP-dependent carboligase